MREGDACQHGLTCANCVTESFTEKICPSPPAGVAGLGVVRPEIDVPHRVKRAGFSQPVGASAQKVLFHGRVLCELGESAGALLLVAAAYRGTMYRWLVAVGVESVPTGVCCVYCCTRAWLVWVWSPCRADLLIVYKVFQ